MFYRDQLMRSADTSHNFIENYSELISLAAGQNDRIRHNSYNISLFLAHFIRKIRRAAAEGMID